MIYRYTDEDLQEYFNNPAINQSALKTIIDPYKGIEFFIAEKDQLLRQEELYYEEKTHFVIGSGVDCFITQGEEIFKNKYHYSNLKKKPSDAVKSIINMVYDTVSASTPVSEILPFISYKEEIYHAANEHAYSMNRKMPTEKALKDEEAKLAKDPTFVKTTPSEWIKQDTRWSSMKNAEEYWADLIKANGKQVLTEGEYTTINSIVTSFTTHPHTRHLFAEYQDVDIVYQFPMYWNYLDEPCKGLMDMIIINHTQRRIRRIDLKTFGEFITAFPKLGMEKRRYDVQGSFYNYGFHHNLVRLSELLGKDVLEYDLAPFAFVAESTKKPGTPLIYVMTTDLELQGTQGNNTYLKGWYQGMIEYKKWKDVDFSVEQIYKKTNGIIWLSPKFEEIINP